MKVYISKEGKNFGPFAPDELRSHLDAGHFSNTDHAMPEGGKEWQTVQDLLLGFDSPAKDSGAEVVQDDDVDYDKLKQWEDEFEDFDDKEEDSSSTEASITKPLDEQPKPESPKPTSIVQPTPPTQEEVVEKLPQQPPPSSAPAEVKLPEAVPQATEESSAIHDEPTVEETVPTPDQSPAQEKSEIRRDSGDDKSRPRRKASARRSPSQKISGMNRGQTVIVVKGGGIGSKIFTTLIVLFVLALIVGVICVAAYFMAPQAVGPILKKIGIPVQVPDPVGKKKDSKQTDNSSKIELANFSGLSLTEDNIQQLRTLAVDFYRTDEGTTLRCVASVDPELPFVDDDLAALEPLSRKLVWLDLTKGKLTDAGLTRLSAIPNLRRLFLEDNKGITSRGISDLAALKNLQCLNLVGTSLDDSVIDVLTGMTSLREVYLWRSGVSSEAVGRLREARPDMLVQSS